MLFASSRSARSTWLPVAATATPAMPTSFSLSVLPEISVATIAAVATALVTAPMAALLPIATIAASSARLILTRRLHGSAISRRPTIATRSIAFGPGGTWFR